jgi:hypothetical protein
MNHYVTRRALLKYCRNPIAIQTYFGARGVPYGIVIF